MSRLQRILIANISVVTGCFAALFLVPPSTPVSVIALAGLAALTMLNLVIFVGPRIRKTTGSTAHRNFFTSAVVWTLLAILIVVEILIRFGYLSYPVH